MRIGILTTSYPEHPGDPSGHFVRAEARALSRAGHDVVVFAPRHAPGFQPGAPSVQFIRGGSAFGWPGVLARVRERPLRAALVLSFLRDARRALRRHGAFDRLIAHWLVPAGFPLASEWASSAELEVVVHGSDLRLLAMLPDPVRRAITRRLSSRGAVIRCVSHELQALLERVDPELARRSRVEASPIDLDDALPRDQARRALQVGDRRVLLIVARLIEEKRVDVALAAAALVPGARSVVIGDGPLRSELARRFPQGEFLGTLPRTQTLNWIAAADVLLCTSEREGAPTVVREARALHTPVVAVRAGDLLDWSNRDPGLFVLDRG